MPAYGPWSHLSSPNRSDRASGLASGHASVYCLLTGTMDTPAELRRRSSTDSSVKAFHEHLHHVIQDMEGLGIVTQLADKVQYVTAAGLHG